MTLKWVWADVTGEKVMTGAGNKVVEYIGQPLPYPAPALVVTDAPWASTGSMAHVNHTYNHLDGRLQIFSEWYLGEVDLVTQVWRHQAEWYEHYVEPREAGSWELNIYSHTWFWSGYKARGTGPEGSYSMTEQSGMTGTIPETLTVARV